MLSNLRSMQQIIEGGSRDWQTYLIFAAFPLSNNFFRYLKLLIEAGNIFISKISSSFRLDFIFSLWVIFITASCNQSTCFTFFSGRSEPPISRYLYYSTFSKWAEPFHGFEVIETRLKSSSWYFLVLHSQCLLRSSAIVSYSFNLFPKVHNFASREKLGAPAILQFWATQGGDFAPPGYWPYTKTMSVSAGMCCCKMILHVM